MRRNNRELDFIELFVPEEILLDFDFDKLVEEGGVFRIYLVEKNDVSHIPPELKSLASSVDDIVLDGYTNYLELQTYPAQGKEVFIYLKRRRWKLREQKEEEDGRSYTNSYNYNESGMKATRAFGAFLKEIGRG